MAEFRTYTAIGQREDLSNTIYNIAPTETPVVSSIGKTKATATFHEWQTDDLAAASAAGLIEGADATGASDSPTTRVGNRTQIQGKTVHISGTLDAVDKAGRKTETAYQRVGNRTQIQGKTVHISGTLDAVDKAGRKTETAYQLAKAGQELKRDMEKTILGNVGQSNGTAGSAARLLGSIQTWLQSNFVTMTDGAAPTTNDGVNTRTEGTTAAAFTEQKLKDCVKSVFENGGTPTLLVVPPTQKQVVSTQKQVVSTFAGIAAQRYEAPKNAATTIIGAADVYLSDFGTLSVVPDRFMTADVTPDAEQALVLDPTMASVATLRPFESNLLAKSGDSEKHQMLVEYTLQVSNEKAHGIVADLAV
jgi:hypothetical protein